MSTPAFRWRNAAGYMAIAVAALLAAEVFLSLVLSGTIEKSEWFSAGVNTPHPGFGFVLTPRHEGLMRHEDGVFLTPLKLDANGFRLAAARRDSRQDVLMLGGRSMAFSFGLTDSQSLHAQVGEFLKTPATVHNSAWPGFELARNFDVYKSILGTGPAPDFTVISFFMEDEMRHYAGLGADFAHSSDPTPGYEDLFFYYDDLALQKPADALALAFGKAFHRSIVVHKLVLYLRPVWYRLQGLLGGRAIAPVQSHTAARALGRERFGEFTAHLQDFFGGPDKVLFVMLPGRSLSPGYYDHMLSALPRDAQVLDLNRLYGEHTKVTGYIAHGHYSPRSAAFVGRKIAERINEIQQR